MRSWGLAILVGCVLLPGAAWANDLVVIVHPDREVRLGLVDIAQIYLKQRRFWEDGGAIVPVNREAGSALRETFAKTVFETGFRGLMTYWNREYFRGVLPPITLASDEAVRRFVAAEPRAVGYISRDFLDESVRVVLDLESVRD